MMSGIHPPRTDDADALNSVPARMFAQAGRYRKHYLESLKHHLGRDRDRVGLSLVKPIESDHARDID
jgi:hypothetical protein